MRATPFVLGIGLVAGTAHAQTRSQVYGQPLEQEAQTVYLRADAGISTYESEAAGSKETKETISYILGGWVGESRTAGLSIASSQAKVPYSLNQAKTDTSFADVRAHVRLGWLIPSIGVSLSELDVERDGAQTVSLYATGASAGLGLMMPVYRTIVVYGDAMVVKPTKSYDKIEQTTKLGERKDGDAGVSFDVTDRMIDLLIGYKIREYSIDTADETFHEKTQGAYAGLRLGLYF
jgi:hypothetical protein